MTANNKTEKEIILQYRKAIGKELERLRIEKGLNRHNVKKLSNMTDHQILDIERGDRSYGIDNLIRYLLTTGLPVPFIEEPISKLSE